MAQSVPGAEATPAATSPVALDPVALLLHASAPVQVTVVLLLASSLLVWLVLVLKLGQLARLRSSTSEFESRAWPLDAPGLADLAQSAPDNPGSRVVRALLARETDDLDRLKAAAERALVDERRRASLMLSPLGTVAGTAPFVGLFGTVYGIMDAFVRIGAEKSASLPVVAPAIGEALVTTAIGLATAIPALVFYNLLDKRTADYVAELEASAMEWAHALSGQGVETRRIPDASVRARDAVTEREPARYDVPRTSPVYPLQPGAPPQRSAPTVPRR